MEALFSHAAAVPRDNIDRVRPLVVLVSGAPGAGESTLARQLRERLGLPVIDKDILRSGARWTLDLPSLDGVPPGYQLFYDAIEALLGLGISLICDMTLFPEVSPPDVSARLAPRADLVCIHCYTPESVNRFISRGRRLGVPDQEINDILPLVVELGSDLVEPLDLGCPTMTIDTTDGTDRYLDDIAAFVTTTRRDLVQHRRSAAHGDLGTA